MDVIYDFVEGIHIFIPLIAIFFIITTLYLGRNGEKKSKSEEIATEPPDCRDKSKNE